jgi:hypothetical protein
MQERDSRTFDHGETADEPALEVTDSKALEYPRRVRHPVRKVCIGLALLAAGAFAFWHLPSEERAVRDAILELANEGSYSNGDLRDRPARLERVLTNHVTDPVTLDIEAVDSGNYTKNELLAGYLDYARQFRSLAINLTHVEVDWDRSQERATVRAHVELVLERTTGSRHVEPRKLRCTLERRGTTWQVTYARLTAKRVDEPEARP